MQHHRFTKKKSTPVFAWIALIVIVVIIWISVALTRPISIHETVIVKKGDTLNAFLSHLTGRERLKVKSYIRTHSVDLANIQFGTYQFSGSYSPEAFIAVVQKGPTSEYVRFTVLEGWSIYDIDNALTQKGFIKQGEYIAYVSSSEVIDTFTKKYSYMASAYATNKFHSLEGWLYPDTYFIDPSKDIFSQLVSLQLKAFNEKVYTPYASPITAFPSLLQAKGITLSYTMDIRNVLRLASIIEKEERNTQNKPTVAGIFFNRLEQGTTLGADITLCYGLKKPYDSCTPSVIAQHLDDTNNLYNTRALRGLTPTPIANPSVDTIAAVLNFTKTNYFFYLHDKNGVIRYAENIQGHNDNISKYLK